MSLPTDTQLNFAGFPAGIRLDEPTPPGADWKTLMNRLEALGPDEIMDRAETARRIIREQGVACHLSDESKGVDCPWKLDILPLAISAVEWQSLEAGLIQRARLLNAVLRDLYGYQHCLRNGWVPAPLVYANPNYLRGCQGVRVPGENYIPFYAVDLARSQEGRWSVVADRTQAPAGIGFALENRAVVSRVLPEAIQALQPRPIESILPVIRQTLVNLAPGNPDNPTIVVMSPGPRSENYFEHTYLARMLGCTLAEGCDLTVRDRRVFIKTLEGLRPVDVILRRVHDAYCDPLEFQSSSLLGVPGLLEVVRAGHVALGNALGCGLAESPALMPFLPSLCQFLLGEELLIPSLATWWCGGIHEFHHVTANLDRLVLRPAFSLTAESRIAAGAQRAQLEAQLAAAPHEFIGQQEMVLSQIPALSEDRFGSAPFILRTFVIGDGNTFQVLPGGLVRLPQRRRIASMAMSLAGGSKDVWVLPDGPSGREAERAEPVLSAVGERVPIDLPSSAADNLFWLGRYSERLENQLRITRCVLGYLSENLTGAGIRRLSGLAGLLGRLGMIPRDLPQQNLRDELTGALLSVISDPARPAGVRDLIEKIYRSAFALRDRLSVDTWRLLNRLEQDANIGPGSLGMLAASTVLDTLVLDLAAFSGMEMENMTRGHGWRFLDIGRRMERSVNLLELVRFALAPSERSDLLYEPLLDICDSVITYRRRHFAEMRLHGVLNLLLLEPDNPRSLAFQLAALEEDAANLPEDLNPAGVAKVRTRITGLIIRLGGLQFEEREPAAAEHAENVSEYLSILASELKDVSELLTQVYFNHIVPRVN